MCDVTAFRGCVVFGIAFGIAFSVVHCSPCCASEAPIGIVAERVSTYRADLLWFYSNTNDSIAAHDDGGWEHAAAVRSDDRDNRVAVRFSDFSLPVFVTAGSAFILNYDPDPSIPGDPFSTIEISLHLDDDGLPGQLVAGPVEVGASGEWVGGGEWVAAPLEYLHNFDAPIWLQVRWPSSNPYMPKLGGDSGAPTYDSYVGYVDDGDDIWKLCSDFNMMLRLRVLNNSKDSPVAMDESDVDSFTVYSRDRLPLYPSDAFVDTSCSGWILNQRVIPDNIDNYYCVTSWVEGVESSPSAIVHMEGTSGASAPATITPRHIELTVPFGTDTVAYMAIKNRGYATLQYWYYDYAAIAKITAGFPMAILNGSGSIYPGRTDSIEFRIRSAGLACGDYMEAGYIGFSDSLEVYVPVDVSIYLEVDQLTTADDIHEQIPRSCLLHQNYPNPFNGETTIIYENPIFAGVQALRVVDILGRRVVIIDPSCMLHEVVMFHWDGRDETGRRVPSGVYFYKLDSEASVWHKMLMIR